MYCKLQKFPACLGPSPRSVVIFSGGQDSTLVLALARRWSEHVIAVSFDYGQQHRAELDAAARIAARLGVEHQVLGLAALSQVGNSALLLGNARDVNQQHPRAPHLPASFVPGRNGLFLQLAAALGHARDFPLIWGGWSEEDFSGYPDCRSDFLEAQERALRLGMNWSALSVCAPLLGLTKAQIFRAAHEHSPELLTLILEETMTCYRGARLTRRPWGYGCGDCPACNLRAKGYREFLEDMPALP